MAIICTADIATRLGLSPSDNSLVGVAESVNASIVAFLWFDPSANAGRTEFFSSGGSQSLALNHGPIVESSVVVHCVDTWFWGWGSPGAFGQGTTDPFTSDTLLVRGEDYAVDTDAGSTGPVLLRLNGVWPVSTMRPPNRLAGDLVPALGVVKAYYEVNDAGVLAVARNAAMNEALFRVKIGYYGFGFATTDSMDGASVSITPYVRPPGAKAARGGLLSPAAVEMLNPFYRRAL